MTRRGGKPGPGLFSPTLIEIWIKQAFTLGSETARLPHKKGLINRDPVLGGHSVEGKGQINFLRSIVESGTFKRIETQAAKLFGGAEGL